ncbi:Vacuolar protein sorting-associated protein 13B [Dissostichus eleginoides]|uniref:Vacuolar protein sorting-associated protein 13B n=1 Tax=Dissostichus eleginoides TaxID=100907 RepID=A0AAD9C6Y1_DISEL|nr:Vacuolar protein sorting-associated protein 13B [Dissostichus eleginoides]
MSIPMKVMPDTTAVESWATSEERMKELIAQAWDAVKRLTLQFAEPVIASTSLCPPRLWTGPHHVLQQ